MEPDLIYETSHWRTILAADQAYLGRSVVVLKRPCGDLANMKEEELLDFLQVVRKLENAFRKAFNAAMFNWSCLMNLAYQNHPPNPQVHWHVRPRYSQKVEFADEVFEDKEFGHHYASGAERIFSPEVRKLIIQKVKDNL